MSDRTIASVEEELRDQAEHGDRVFRALQKAGIKVSTALIGGWCPGDPEPEFVIENPKTEQLEAWREAAEDLESWHMARYSTTYPKCDKARALDTAAAKKTG